MLGNECALKMYVQNLGYTHLIAYSLSNISAKNYPKSVDLRRSYSVLHQCRFLGHLYVSFACVQARYIILMVIITTPECTWQ